MITKLRTQAAKANKAAIVSAVKFALAQKIDRMPVDGTFVLVRNNRSFLVFVGTKRRQQIGSLAFRIVNDVKEVGKIVL